MRQTNNNWTTRTIADICERVTSGGTPSRSKPEYFQNGTTAWVKTGELNDWTIDLSSIEERITDEALTQSSAKLYPKGTVLMAMYGDGRTIGSLGLVVEPVASNQACCALIPKKEACDPQFLLYALRVHRDKLIKIAHGGAQRNLSGTIIKNFAFAVPPLPTQRRIADILSAYDDLIENNTRRIAILEEMVRRVYEKWFAEINRLALTGKTKTLPQGWVSLRLAQVAAVNPESISKLSSPERISYIDIASVSPGKIDKVTEMAFSEAPSRARRVVRHGDLLWSSVRPNRRSYALAIHPQPNTIASTGFAVLRAEHVPFAYLYSCATSPEFVGHLVSHAKGAAYPAVSQEDFENAILAVPNKAQLQRFNQVAEPVLLQSACLHRMNEVLANSRDVLLPRLISGEIDVSEAPLPGTAVAA